MRQIKHVGHIINYLGNLLIYKMTLSEQYISIFEVFTHELEEFLEALDNLGAGDLYLLFLLNWYTC